MSYNLTLGKKYVLNTVNGTIFNEKVKVVGILTRDECEKNGVDVRIMANSEKVLGKDDDNYLDSLTYFKCESIGDDNFGTIFIVWSDIIDGSKTNLLEEKYTYAMNITVPSGPGGSIPVSTIVNDLASRALSQYGAIVEFKPTAGDSTSAEKIYLERIAQAEKIIRGLNSLALFVPMLEKLNSGDLSKKLDSISSEVDILNEKLTTIAAGLA